MVIHMFLFLNCEPVRDGTLDCAHLCLVGNSRPVARASLFLKPGRVSLYSCTYLLACLMSRQNTGPEFGGEVGY